MPQRFRRCEVVDDVCDGADRLGSLPVGAQRGDVLLEGGHWKRIGQAPPPALASSCGTNATPTPASPST
jgi:hypothetical protein